MIKHQLGKLPLPEPPENYLPEQRRRHRISSLMVDEASVARLAGLPPLHRDPFDRLLICQALEHGRTLITVDDAIRAYPVDTA
jgi:PIN domain nuclease of toxin-antitoxin system